MPVYPYSLCRPRKTCDTFPWKQLFEVPTKIVTYTNIKIASVTTDYLRARDSKSIDYVELKAFFGLLLLAGVNRSGHQNLVYLWRQNDTNVDMLRLIMEVNRFRFLLQILHFDISNNLKNERKKSDNLTCVRKIFDEFLSYCKNFVGKFVTVAKCSQDWSL